MTEPQARWYPDPTGRHQLRYWDGSQWTEHVATAGVPSTDPPTMPPGPRATVRPARSLLAAGVLAGVLAIVAGAIPFAWFARAITSDEVALPAGQHELTLPAHRTYGVYVDDADNSGYSERCSATDASGRRVRMKDPSWNIGWFSDTENLDFVFDTGSGDLRIECSVPGERVTLRQVPNDTALVLGGLLGSLLFATSIGLLIGWVAVRTSSPRS